MKALAGVLSWLEHRSVNQKVMGLIPGQDTCLGCGFSPQLGCMQKAADQCFSLTSMFLSLSVSLPLPLSLKSVSMSLGEDLKKKKDEEEEVDSIICEHLVGFHGLAGFCYLNIYWGYNSHPALSPCKFLNIRKWGNYFNPPLIDEKTKTGRFSPDQGNPNNPG